MVRLYMWSYWVMTMIIPHRIMHMHLQQAWPVAICAPLHCRSGISSVIPIRHTDIGDDGHLLAVHTRSVLALGACAQTVSVQNHAFTAS